MTTKSVTIDGKPFDITISNFDTIDTVTLYVAKLVNTLPETIFLTSKDAMLIENIEITNLPFKSVERLTESSSVKNIALSFETLEHFIKKEKGLFLKKFNLVKKLYESQNRLGNEDPKVSEETLLFYTFYYYFDKTKSANFIENSNDPLFTKFYFEVFTFREELGNDSYPITSEYEFVNKYNDFYKKFELRLARQTESIKNYTDINTKLKKYKKEANETKNSMSPVKLSFTNITVKLSPFVKDEFELFNNSNLSRDVPMMYISGFYKILKNFVCPKEWLDVTSKQPNNTLVLFVLNRYNEPEKNFDSPSSNNYSLIKIRVIKNTIEIKISSKVEDYNVKRDLKEEQLLMRICYSLNIQNIVNQMDCKIYPESIKASFFIPNKMIEKLIYYDLVMNNKIVSSFMTVNERYRIYTKKGGVQTIFSLDAEDAKSSQVFSLQTLVTTPPLKKIIGPSVSVGDYVVEIKVNKAKDLASVDTLQTFLSYLVEIYNEEKQGITSFYEKYSDNFEKENELVDNLEDKKKIISEMKEPKLRDYDPDLFVPGYPKKCNKSPKIIEEKEAKKKMQEGIDIMKYPLYDEFKVHYYTCENQIGSKHPYPGLIKTEISPHLLPCCFDVDQLKKKSSWRYIYENQISQEDVPKSLKTKKLKIYKTSRVLTEEGVGQLASDVNQLLRLIDGGNLYIRKNIPLGPRAVILAIASALGIKDLDTKEKREAYVESKVKEMIKIIDKNIGFQNAYSYSPITLKQFLTQKEKFIDLHIFHTILEEVFKCNILFFVHNQNFPNGTLASPYFMNNLLLNKKKHDLKNFVILYETTGTKIENLEYPHYEVVTKFIIKEKKLITTFVKSDVVIKDLVNIYKQMYIPSGNLTNSIIPTVSFNSKIIAQQTDYFGKTRIIKFSTGVNIVTQPIDSLPDSLIESDLPSFEFNPVTLQKALEFVEKEQVEYSLVEISSYIVGLRCYKNFNFYIPVIPTKKPVGFNDKKSNDKNLISVSFIQPESQIDTFIKFERVSRHLLAHVLYIFSQYLSKNKLALSSENVIETIENFYDDKMKVDNNVDESIYENIPRNFSEQKNFIRGGKIIITSEELAKRLLYSILIECKKGYKSIMNYKNLVFVPNYYVNIRDFNTPEESILFYKKESVIEWIKSQLLEQPSHLIHQYINRGFLEDLNNDFALLKTKMITNNEELFVCSKVIDVPDNYDGLLVLYNGEEDIKLIKVGNSDEILLMFRYQDIVYTIYMIKYSN